MIHPSKDFFQLCCCGVVDTWVPLTSYIYYIHNDRLLKLFLSIRFLFHIIIMIVYDSRNVKMSPKILIPLGRRT